MCDAVIVPQCYPLWILYIDLCDVRELSTEDLEAFVTYHQATYDWVPSAFTVFNVSAKDIRRVVAWEIKPGEYAPRPIAEGVVVDEDENTPITGTYDEILERVQRHAEVRRGAADAELERR